MLNIYDEYFFEDFNNLTKCLKSIDKSVFDDLLLDCYSCLKSGNKIIATGLGKNVPICEKFVGTMLSMGLNANFLHTNTAVHGDMGMIKDGDLIIVLSKSGSTKESIYLVDLLEKKEKIKIWLISFDESGILSKRMLNRIVAKLEHEGDLWNIVPNHSSTLYLLILQKIAIELSKKMGLTLENDFKPNHPGGAIGEKLNEK